MQVLSFAALLALSAVGAAATGVTPVQKVIQLMEGMAAKGKKEKHDEQVQFAAYKQFCDDTEAEKKQAIKTAEETIEILTADIEKYMVDAARLKKEIAGHDEDITVWKGDVKVVTKVRNMAKADYDALHMDLSESVSALQRAIAVLKKQAYDRKQASSLVQVSELTRLRLIPESAKRSLAVFLQQAPDTELDVTAPESEGYEFQSSGVVEMLEGLLDKFIAQRTDVEKEEMNEKHAFDMLIQDHTAQIEQATLDREEKSKVRAKKLKAKATAEGDRTDTVATKEADEKYLADLVATCEKKASDFEARQALRAEELEAIAKAIEIISSGAVSGSAKKHLPTMLQRASALASLRAEVQSPKQAQVAVYLQGRAKQLSSRVLSALASHVADDPFVKVKKMIKDLIVRLLEEANAEAEHKGWCDTELATNEKTRQEKTEGVESLQAEIDELQASIAKLTEEITELTKAVADLDKAMAEAVELREKEKAKNAETVADADAAQVAVARAVTVLKDFYSKAAEATALMQRQQPEAPEIFDSPYKGMQSENGGVIGMLEVIESDFSRLEAETKANEATAQKEHDEFMTDSKVDKKSKNTDIKHKTAKKQDESQALTVAKDDLEGTQKELDAALAYFDKLKPSCVDADVSYDERVARRKEEIESLQEALKILNGEDLA